MKGKRLKHGKIPSFVLQDSLRDRPCSPVGLEENKQRQKQQHRYEQYRLSLRCIPGQTIRKTVHEGSARATTSIPIVPALSYENRLTANHPNANTNASSPFQPRLLTTAYFHGVYEVWLVSWQYSSYR